MTVFRFSMIGFHGTKKTGHGLKLEVSTFFLHKD